MKGSMLTRLVFGSIILSVVFSGAETTKGLEGWSVPALLFMIAFSIAVAYLGMYLLLKGMRDAITYLKS